MDLMTRLAKKSKRHELHIGLDNQRKIESLQRVH